MEKIIKKQLIIIFVVLFTLILSTTVSAGSVVDGGGGGSDRVNVTIINYCSTTNEKLGTTTKAVIKGSSVTARNLWSVDYNGYTWISDTSVASAQSSTVLYNYYVRASSGGSGSGGGSGTTTPSSYTVTVKDCVDSQSGYVLGSGAYTVSAGSSAYATALRSTTYSGYRLLEGTYSNSVSSNITLYRIFNKISTYAVSYNGNGSTSGSMPNDTFEVGQTKRLSPNAYSKEYTVSFNTDGGENISPETLSYEFKGWALSPNGEVVYEDNQEVSNLTTTDGATTSN